MFRNISRFCCCITVALPSQIGVIWSGVNCVFPRHALFRRRARSAVARRDFSLFIPMIYNRRHIYNLHLTHSARYRSITWYGTVRLIFIHRTRCPMLDTGLNSTKKNIKMSSGTHVSICEKMTRERRHDSFDSRGMYI